MAYYRRRRVRTGRKFKKVGRLTVWTGSRNSVKRARSADLRK